MHFNTICIFCIFVCQTAVIAGGVAKKNRKINKVAQENRLRIVNQEKYSILRDSDPEDEIIENPPPEEEQVYKIGALFDHADSVEEIAFKLAIERFNIRNEEAKVKLKAHIDYVIHGSYFIEPKVCEILQAGVVAIFGPQSQESASHAQFICDAFEVPHIDTTWDYQIRGDLTWMSLAPHPEILSQAYKDLVKKLNWNEYIGFYEDREGLVRLQDVIQLPLPNKVGPVMKLPSGNDLKQFFYDFLDADSFTNFIIDCSPKTAFSVLRQAEQVGFLNAKIKIIFTTMDLATIDLDEFKYSRAEITAFRLVDPNREDIKEVVAHWEQYAASENSANNENSKISEVEAKTDEPAPPNPDEASFFERFDIEHLGKSRKNKGGKKKKKPINKRDADDNNSNEDKAEDSEKSSLEESKFPEWLTTDVAMIFDAVDLVGHALQVLGSIQELEIPELHCQSSDSWPQGYSLVNYMKASHIQGLTGWIQFNTTGFRTDIGLEIVQLKPSGLEKVGAWDIKLPRRIQMKDDTTPVDGIPQENEPGTKLALEGITLKVTTIMGAPMCMWKRSTAPHKGNDRYEGYAIELVQKLSKMYGFEYEIIPQKDGKYGGQDKDGNWNGMVREVMVGEVDLAVADLTVNKQRAAAIDLTMPFMTLGISILFVAPSAKPPDLLSFMNPMDKQVWMCVCLAIVGTTLTLYFCARVSPYEWIVPHPCIDDPDELENEFNLRDSFFFVIGTYLCQGAAIAPKTASTRMVAGFWWLFTLIMVSSYTANLATFLIVQDLDEPFKVASDLPNQTRIKYGCVAGGTTAKFFQTSPFEHFKQIYKVMEESRQSESESVYQTSNSNGVKRVLKEKGLYAFFMESTQIEYNVERNCKLHKVGGLLDDKGYAIGLRKGSNLTQLFSSAILKFQERGDLDEMKRKWWKEERKENACDEAQSDEEAESSVKALTLANVGGIFVVLIVGCIVSLFISCLELLENAYNLSSENESSFCTELANELKFACSCRGTTKPVKKDAHNGNSASEEEIITEKIVLTPSKKSSASDRSCNEKEVLVCETLTICTKCRDH